jgi:hypothetical protein
MARAYLRAFEQFTGFGAEVEGDRSYRDPDELTAPLRVGSRADRVKA